MTRVADCSLHRIQVRSVTNCGPNVGIHLHHQRNSYFATKNFVRSSVFSLVDNNHCQHNGVLEAEAARIDDMIERIRSTAD